MARVGTASKNAWDFVPTTIPGCSLWLDGADTSTMFTNGTNSIAPTTPATVGSRVQYWRDKSQNASYALQTQGNSQPILQTEPVPGLAPQTNLTSLYFNGGTQRMDLPNGAMLPLGTSDGTYFVVSRMANSVATSLYTPFSHGGGTNGSTLAQARLLIMSTSNCGLLVTQTGVYGAPANVYGPNLITGGIKDYIQYGFLNGSAATANNLLNNQGNAFVSSGGTLSTNASVGAAVGTGTGTLAFIGNISEILVYNRALNNYERQQVEGYLALKWGITSRLPEATHPYYNTVAQGFNPQQLGSCLMWLDASTLTGTDNSAVTTWTGVVNSATNTGGTAPTLVTNSLNGRNTVRFNGSQFLDIGNASLTANINSFTIFIVAQSTNGSATARQVVFTQGPPAYPTALNGTSRPVVEGYFNGTNRLSFDYYGMSQGSTPTSSAVYLNSYVASAVNFTAGSNPIVAWETGNSFPNQSNNLSYIVGNARARIGASRKPSNCTSSTVTAPSTVTITTTGSDVVPYVNQIINFSVSGSGVTSDINYYIVSVTGTSSPYTITIGTTRGVAVTNLANGSANGPARLLTVISATTDIGDTVTIISSTLPTVNQPIMFETAIGGVAANTQYYILNVIPPTVSSSYVIQLSTTIGGSVFPITSTNGNTAVVETSVENYMTGNIAEIIYYGSTNLSTVQRQRVEGYLAWKWGLQASLPTSHPFALANYFYNNTKPTSRIFAPPDIEGCQLWIDPTDLQTAGYAVSAWNDKTSGTAYHATQATANLRPYYIPAQKGLYFAASEYLSLPNSALSLFQNVGYASMFMVVRVPQPSTMVGGALFGANTTAGTDRFRPSIVASSSLYATYGAILQRANSDAVVTTTSAVAYPYGGMTILNIEVTYSTNSARFSRNGTQDYLGTAGLAAAGVTDNTASTLITVGAPVGGRQDNFYMHELLLYTSSPLSDANRDLTHGYLAWKWGLQTSLPSTSVYSPFNATPATAGPSAAATGYKLWLDGADDTTITYTANSVAMLTDKSGSENPVVNNQSTLTMTTYTKPEGTTLPMLQGSSTGAANTLTTRTVPRDTSNHTYAFVVKYPATGNSTSNTVLSYYTPPVAAITSPLQISGCALWLDGSNSSATNMTLVGSSVSVWKDLSGNGRNATPVSAAPQLATNVQNGLPGILFSGAGTMKCGAFLTSTNLSMFSVSNTTGGGYDVSVWKVQFGSLAGVGSGAIVTAVNKTGAYVANFISFTDRPRVSALTLASSTTAGSAFTMNASVNGRNTLITGISTNGNADTCAQEVAIGGLIQSGTIAGTTTGHIHEVIIFNVELTTTQRQQIEGYLAFKWGLQANLPTTHPYYPSPGGTETFGHSGTDTNPRLENFNNIPGGISTYSPYGSFGSADAFYGGNTFVCMCVRQNGVWTFTTNGVNYGTISPYALRKLASGTYSLGVNNFSSAQLGDVIVYNNAISPGEQQQLEGYLSWKWGLQRTVTSTGNSLPTTHPYYNYPPSTTVPLVNATQLYKKTFDITDLAPALWLDANDPKTYALDANNRVQWMSNKGLGGLKASFTISSVSGTTFTVSGTTNLSPGQAFEFGVTTITISGITPIVSTPAAPVFFYVVSVLTATTITISSTFGGTALTGATGTATCYVSQRFTRQSGPVQVAATVTSASGSGTEITYTSFNSFDVGQTVTVTGFTPTGFNVSNATITSSSSTQFRVSNATPGTPTGTGTAIATISTPALNGPLLTQSAVGTGNGLNYLDFSSGGTFRITGGSTNSTGTSVTLTLNATHNIPATRQVRVVVSGGTYSTDASTSTGITGTYIVSAQTGTTITIPYTSSQNSATINSIVGYVEYGSIILSNISMASGSSTAVFNTSFPHGLTTSDSIFLSLAGSTIANFPVALNLANGVYTPSAVTSTSFTITTLMNLGVSAITSDGTITNTTLISTTSPSYAYFPYNGYCLESRSATGMINVTNVSVFMVTHTNPGANTAASSIARCGRNTSTQPSIFATSVTTNDVSGNNAIGTGVFGSGRDFNVRLANYNAVGNNLTTSTTPSIRLGTKRCGLSTTSAALTDTTRSVTNTANGFRVMTANFAATTGNTETGIMSSAVTSCAWKPSNLTISSQPIPLMNTTYMNATQGALQIYQVSSTGGSDRNATATFVPYGCEPTDNPYFVGQTISVGTLSGAAAGYNIASTTVTAVTPTTVSYTTAVQQTAGVITGQRGNTFLGGSYQQGVGHIRIGADTCATTGYSSLAGYLTDRFFDGGIAEILVFNSYLTEGQRMLVEGYLAQKYNCQDYIGATTNYIANGRAFTVGNNSSNVTSSGSTVTITFDPGASTTNPFIPGSQIVVAATSLVPNYTGTYIVTGNSGTNQVSYSVAGNSGNATTVSGVTLTMAGAQSNLFIHPYSAGPANIASNLALSGAFTQNLALWYDAANYSSLTLNGSSVLTWSSKVGNVSYINNVLTPPATAAFQPVYVPNSQNGLPGIEIMSTIAGATLTATSNSGNLATITTSNSSVPAPTVNQAIAFSGSAGNIVSTAVYIIRQVNVVNSTTYNIQVGASTGVTLTLGNTSSQNIAATIYRTSALGSLSTQIQTGQATTVGVNNEFTYFYVAKRSTILTNANATTTLVSLLQGPLKLELTNSSFFCGQEFTTTLSYSTRGGLPESVPCIIAVYKRGRDLYSRVIGGGKTSQFTQPFSGNNFLAPTVTGLRVMVGSSDTTTVTSGFNGTLYEMMFFRDALTDQAIQQTEGYLAQKWGLRGSLPPTHAYYEVTS